MHSIRYESEELMNIVLIAGHLTPISSATISYVMLCGQLYCGSVYAFFEALL